MGEPILSFVIPNLNEEVVIGRASDGGCPLAGMPTPTLGLHADIPSSAAAVLEASRARPRTQALEWLELETLGDLDSEPDFESVAAAAGRGELGRLLRTAVDGRERGA